MIAPTPPKERNLAQSTRGFTSAVVTRVFLASAIAASIGACDRIPRADPPDRVASPATITELTPAAVAQLIALDPAAVVVDVNPRDVYDANHVPDARWMSSSDVRFDALPQNRDAPVVFYCYNELCRASHQAAATTAERGWRNVSRMPAGIVGWKAAGLPVEPPAPVSTGLVSTPPR